MKYIFNRRLQEGKCPKCGNPFYIIGDTCYSCGYRP